MNFFMMIDTAVKLSSNSLTTGVPFLQSYYFYSMTTQFSRFSNTVIFNILVSALPRIKTQLFGSSFFLKLVWKVMFAEDEEFYFLVIEINFFFVFLSLFEPNIFFLKNLTSFYYKTIFLHIFCTFFLNSHLALLGSPQCP